MERRDFIKLAGVGIAGAAFSKPLSILASTANKLDSRPNVLLIISDDQGYADMSCTKLAPDVHTPNLDRLAASGARFTQAYATSPVCSPSRAGLITGCYQERFGTYWFGGKGIFDTKFKTIAEVAKEQGYSTAYLGKFHYGADNVHVPGNRNFPTEHGYDYLYGFAGGRKHYLIHNQKEQEKHVEEAKKYNSPWGGAMVKDAFWVNDKKVDQEGFSTELLGAEARKFMKENRNNKFFLTLSFNAVHNFAHQLPKEYLEKHKLSGFRDWSPSEEDYYEWYKKGRNPSDPEGRAYYLGQLYYLDLEIGKILDYIKKMKLDKNTVIVYVSDNGGSVTDYANNKGLRGGKYTLYEGGIRVHLMFSYANHFQKSKVFPNVVSAMDIYPTVCSLIGAKIPDYLDGINLKPLLAGKQKNLAHQTLVWDTKYETAVREGKWKYKTATNDKYAKQEIMELELGEFLYDLENDPEEKVNLIDKYPDKTKELKTIYENWKANLNR